MQGKAAAATIEKEQILHDTDAAPRAPSREICRILMVTDAWRPQVNGVVRTLERLTETARAVVWLHDVEGYTHDEIAGMMGKTPSFSKSQLARAHARLKLIGVPTP